MTISSPTTSLFGNQDMIVTASMSGFIDGETIYIKGAFYFPGTTNYFGLTQYNGEWVKNSAVNASQRSVKIGEWDGLLPVRSDFSDSGYKGEGDYAFKVRYYYGSFTGDWSTNILTVTINEPDPTATLTPSPSPTATTTPSPTASPTQTSAPTPTPLASNTPSPTIKKTPTLKPTTQHTFDILGIQQVEIEDTASGDRINAESGEISSASASQFARPMVFSFLFVGIGIGLLATALAWKKTDIWKTRITQKRE